MVTTVSWMMWSSTAMSERGLAPPPPVHASAGPSSAPQPGSLRALVVEDAEDSRELYVSQLAEAGFSVAQAATGEAALEQSRHFCPHVIVLDLMLPGVNGFTVARAVRAAETHRNVAIVAVTALTSDALRRMALEAGCDAFLCKPIVVAQVIEEAQRLLKTRRQAGGTA
jgi:CheY-like chemotaxis protein